MQCHIVENSVPLGVAAPSDGVAELWFDSAEEIAQAFNEPRYLEIIRQTHEFGDALDQRPVLVLPVGVKSVKFLASRPRLPLCTDDELYHKSVLLA